MDFYELQSRGKIYVEILESLPIWNLNYIGRLIFDLSSNQLYVGGTLNIGWISTSLSENLINTDHINWNLTFEDKTGLLIDANSIPCYYQRLIDSQFLVSTTNITTIQNAIQDLWNAIHVILDGKYYADSSIKNKHLDLSIPDGLNASDLVINNDKLYFGNSVIDINIQQALEILHLRRADSIYMAIDNKFGSKLNIFSNTVQDSFEGIEQYLSTLSANQIFATMPPSNIGCSSDININTVQYALDRLFNELNNLRFIDLKDVSLNIEYGQLLRSCITRHKLEDIDLTINCNSEFYQTVCWEYANSIDIKAVYPDFDGETNVQNILWKIYSDIQYIKKNIINIKNDIIKINQEIECTTYELLTIQRKTIYLKNDITDLKVDIFDIEKNINCMKSDIVDFHSTLNDMEQLLISTKDRCCDNEDLCPHVDPPEILSSCFCHMSGAILYEQSHTGYGFVFVEDKYSNIVENGDYPDATVPFPKAVRYTFDSMAIGSSTRCQFWAGKNFTGIKFLDVQGPMIIYNLLFMTISDLDSLPDTEFINFPRSTRTISNIIVLDHQFDNMRTWQSGSLKITCG